ncbi:MAG: GIY-YIG nuclease family protein [Candidatus Methanomethylophilaceae archaeon]|nr:GIY-YIG nuclease family protein [Candidatus Methanomethylophilaceae archaeon]
MHLAPNPVSSDWCGFEWTDWVGFSEVKKGILPESPGLYRIRPTGGKTLMYVGQTSRTLDRRVRHELVRTYLSSGDEMPFNDPHTAAQSLWAWNDAEGWEYECSVAPLSLPAEDARRVLEGWEAFALWRYRLETGESTLCNHGRFHPRYTRSRNKSTGVRGRRLDAGQYADSLSSHAPLTLSGNPGDDGWMGVPWSRRIPLRRDALSGLPDGSGLYCVSAGDEIVYIGESADIRKRMGQHLSSAVDSACVRSFSMPGSPRRHLLELENDLIGAFIEQTGSLPLYQFMNSF